MAEHEIVYEHDRDAITSRPVCNAAADNWCHLVCAHDCDEWSDVTKHADGSSSHEHETFNGEIVHHAMKQVDYCIVEVHLAESALDEIGPRETFEVGRIAIKPVWMGEGYDWEREL